MSNSAPAAKLLTTAEVARLLGVSIATVNRRAVKGELLAAQKFPGRTGPRLYDATAIAGLRVPA